MKPFDCNASKILVGFWAEILTKKSTRRLVKKSNFGKLSKNPKNDQIAIRQLVKNRTLHVEKVTCQLLWQ